MKQKRVMGIILAVLLIAVGYLFYVTRVCKVGVESGASGASIRVKNPILWQKYVSGIVECKGGRIMIYPTNPGQMREPVEVSTAKIVLGTGDYPYQHLGEEKKVIYSWDVVVEDGVAAGAISLRSGSRLSPEDVNKYGWMAVQQVFRNMFVPISKRYDPEIGNARIRSLSQMGLEIEY